MADDKLLRKSELRVTPGKQGGTEPEVCSLRCEGGLRGISPLIDNRFLKLRW
jgi:hypothetical protein